jgi:uncharacterized cupin superfamily protein
MLIDDEALLAGLWRTGNGPLGPFDVLLQSTETIYVLSGTGSLRIDGGAPVSLLPGATVTIASGSLTTWVVDADFREVWIYH